MSKLSKSLWLAAGAALGAGATYYLLKKDELDFKEHASELWDKAKDYGEDLVDKVDDYFDDSQTASVELHLRDEAV